MKTIIRLLKMAKKYYWTLAATVLALLGAAVLNLTTPFLVQRLTGSLSDGSATAQVMRFKVMKSLLGQKTLPDIL